MTRALRQQIADRIAQTGPITLSEYMTLCLQHPEHGYYTTRDPLGQDFVTAPEISQIFGELVGLCLAQSWLDQGAPEQFTLAELGPGRGTLMADILRATQHVPGFTEAAQVHLVETSAALRAAQAAQLAGAQPVWHAAVESLPETQPLFLVANEFFDALPIAQHVRSKEDMWQERCVGETSEGLGLVLAPAAAVPALAHRLDDTREGDIVETCPTLPHMIAGIAERIAANRGAALIIDYGDWHSLGDTFQALHAGQMVDPFETPGEADLTAHVDFEAIAQAAAPARHTRLTPQGVFLERLGITARAERLAQGLTGEALETQIAAHRRLTSPLEMGNLFKVLGLLPKGALPLAGLET